MSGGTLDGALGRVVAWSSMGTPARHSGAAVRCIREGARECVPGGRGGRADVHSGSRPARPGRPGRVSDRLRHSAPVQGAVSCTSSRHSSCASASSPRPVAASTSPRFTCGASSSGRNASPWRYVAMPARRLSTRAPSPCSLARPAMAVACTTRVAGRLASCGTGNRGTWLQSTPPCAGGDIRVPHWIDAEPQTMPPRAEARVFDTHLHPRTPLQASRSLSRRRRSRASGEGGCVSSPGSDPRRCGPQCNVCAFPVRVRDRRAEHA